MLKAKQAQFMTCAGLRAGIRVSTCIVSCAHSCLLPPFDGYHFVLLAITHGQIYKMAVVSTVRPSKERLDRFTKAYAAHRPVIQRALTVSFVFYTLAASVWGISGKASSQKTRSRGKGKQKAEDRPTKQGRVAVCIILFS